MYDDPGRTKSTIPGGDTRRGSGARRGSVAVQKVMTAAQVLKHDAETDDSDKKWYQKVSWACVGFAVVLFILCAYSWFDVNTVSDDALMASFSGSPSTETIHRSPSCHCAEA